MAELEKKPVKIVETILRDAHQSQIATRMTTEQMLPIVDKLDKVGYHAVECWGGATFDASLRFLHEDPWERLRKLRDGFKNTKLQMLFRGQNILDIGREPSQIVPEVGFDVIRVSQQLFKCELAGIVELITGSLGQKAINDGQLLDLFILCQDCFVGGKQTVVETFNHGHRKDYKSVLMGLKGTTEHICHIPDHRCFFCNIYSYRLDFIVRHRVYLDSYFLYALAWVPSSGSRPIMKSVSKIAFREAFLLG